MAPRKIAKAKRNDNNNNGGSGGSRQIDQALVVRPLNELDQQWDELLSSIRQNGTVSWNKLSLCIDSVSEAQRLQLKAACWQKTVLYVSSQSSFGEECFGSLQIGESVTVHGQFKPNDTEQNNKTFRHFISALCSINKIVMLDAVHHGPFVTALLTAWAKFNGNPLVDLLIDYLNPNNIPEKKAEKMFWKAVCNLPSVRIIKLQDMHKFPRISARLLLTHIESMVVEDYVGDLRDILYQLGDNIKQLDICLPTKARFRDELPGVEQLFESRPNFGRNMTDFKLKIKEEVLEAPTDSRKLFETLCRQCPRLKTLLILGMFHTPMEVILDNLTKLRDLETLIIDLFLVTLTPELADKYEPLEKVKVVRFLCFHQREYKIDQFRLTIPRLFPNLEALTICTTSQQLHDQLEEQVRELFPRIERPTVALLTGRFPGDSDPKAYLSSPFKHQIIEDEQ